MAPSTGSAEKWRKLKAHGAEIGTVETLTTAIRFMSDGKVLRNQGFGWKLWKTVKDGQSPREAFERTVARQNERFAPMPHTRAYREELHNMAGLCKRWKLHAAVQMMPDDCDGVWSEACDGYGDNVHASVDEVANLCRLFKLAADEFKAAKEAKSLETV